MAGGAGAGYRDGRTDFASFEGASGVEAAVFRHPRGIAADSGGNLFVADAENHCIRGISAQGQVPCRPVTVPCSCACLLTCLPPFLHPPWVPA